jgi:protein TonB
MSVETRKHTEENLSGLGSCLVEGNAEQRTLERRIRRRALAISISVQSLILVAIVLVPLFARTDRIVMANAIFIPPAPSSPHGDNHRRPQPRPHTDRFHTCVVCPTPTVLRRDVSDDPVPPTIGDARDPGNPIGDGPAIPGVPGGSNLLQPVRPHEDPPPTLPRITETHIDPAMLIRRVEPAYPTLPRQMGRAGKVELRAIIATDGSIQSLQVVSGDPLFCQSALDAVRQWRYRPTYLNGQPVEVDTFITVSYTMNR